MYTLIVYVCLLCVHLCAQEEARTVYADPDEFAQEMVKMINEKEFRSALTATVASGTGVSFVQNVSQSSTALEGDYANPNVPSLPHS